MEKKPHEIAVIWYDGTTSKYTTAVMEQPFGVQSDPAVVEIVDLKTGVVLYSVA